MHFSFLIFQGLSLYIENLGIYTNSSSAAAARRSRRLVRPTADDDFLKLVYSLQNRAVHLKKKNSATIILWEKLSANEPENIP